MKKVCVVGYGAIGPIHARALRACQGAELYAVCEPDAARAGKAKAEHGVRIFSDFDEMLKSREVDAVHICTPHYLHLEMAQKALAAGLDVVLEKPVCMNHAEFSALRDAEKNADGRLCVMLQNRYNFCVQTILEEIADREKNGALLGVNGVMQWNRDEAYYRADAWRGKWATEGGGVLINQAIHLIDLMSLVSGGICELRANYSTKLLDQVIEVEDTAEALFRYQNGTRGCFYACNTSAFSTQVQLDVMMEKVRLRYADGMLYEFREEKFVGILSRDDDRVPGKCVWGNGHAAVIRSFYDATNEKNYPLLSDAENSAETLFAMYESSRNGGKWTKTKGE